MIKGITVTLFEKSKVGEDAFGHPVYEQKLVEVEDVIVEPSATTDNLAAEDLYGRKAQYTLHIPKGDTHNWIDSRVDFCGQSFQTFGFPVEYVNDNVPGKWNKKVMVDIYG